MAYAFVQAAVGANGGSGTTQATAAFGASVTAGNAFAYFCPYNHASAEQTATVTGNGNTFTEVGHFRDAGSSYGMRWGYAKNVAAGTTAMSVTFGATVNIFGLLVIEYSGLDTTTPFGAGEFAGQYLAAPGTGTDAWTSGNATPGSQPAAVICCAVNENAINTLVAGTGFTSRGATFNFGFGGNQGFYEDKRITSTSAVAGTMTGGTSDFGQIAMLILREAAAAAGGRLVGGNLAGGNLIGVMA